MSRLSIYLINVWLYVSINPGENESDSFLIFNMCQNMCLQRKKKYFTKKNFFLSNLNKKYPPDELTQLFPSYNEPYLAMYHLSLKRRRKNYQFIKPKIKHFKHFSKVHLLLVKKKKKK